MQKFWVGVENVVLFASIYQNVQMVAGKTRSDLFWLVYGTMDYRQLPTTNKHPGIRPSLFLLIAWGSLGKMAVMDSITVVCPAFWLQKNFLFIEISWNPMDSKYLKYILLFLAVVLDHGHLRDSPEIGELNVCSVWVQIDSRTLDLSSMTNRLIYFSSLNL